MSFMRPVGWVTMLFNVLSPWRNRRWKGALVVATIRNHQKAQRDNTYSNTAAAHPYLPSQTWALHATTLLHE